MVEATLIYLYMWMIIAFVFYAWFGWWVFIGQWKRGETNDDDVRTTSKEE